MAQRETARRGDFLFHVAIQTRWSDNDMFGHVNNVEYYRFFEIAVAEFLMGPCKLDLFHAPFIPFAAESLCRFGRPLSWPEKVTAGLKVEHLGTTSMRYAIALFGEGSDEAAAEGHWVHVFVDREEQRPVPIPPELRAVFEAHRGAMAT
ncbi:MAG: acyl-CoA thioesterase [Magnetospirillum sp.]|nr:acyl-CoA thioesterase [Magnetospirillum sp.]